MSTEVLTDEQISQSLSGLDGWNRSDNAITKSWTFGSFRGAMAFIVRMSYVCEALNHHPELKNVYNNVSLTFSTHDAGDVITDKDIQAAKAINDLES